MKDIRIGIGEDIHRFAPGRKLILGGMEIPYAKGLLAHSDGDVVYHAVADALLEALALGDIGHYFKTNDPKWDNAQSSLIVSEVVKMIEERGYKVGNLDVVLLAEEPHLAVYLEGMRVNLAFLLHVDMSRVGIQAGTEEGLGEVGRKEGIRAKAAVLLYKEESEEKKWTTISD